MRHGGGRAGGTPARARPDPVAVLGHSSGAHLAALAVLAAPVLSRPSRAPLGHPDALVGISGPYDISQIPEMATACSAPARTTTRRLGAGERGRAGRTCAPTVPVLPPRRCRRPSSRRLHDAVRRAAEDAGHSDGPWRACPAATHGTDLPAGRRGGAGACRRRLQDLSGRTSGSLPGPAVPSARGGDSPPTAAPGLRPAHLGHDGVLPARPSVAVARPPGRSGGGSDDGSRPVPGSAAHSDRRG